MEETKYIYADKSEYPEVCVQEKNRQYAAAMLGNVGACDSLLLQWRDCGGEI